MTPLGMSLIFWRQVHPLLPNRKRRLNGAHGPQNRGLIDNAAMAYKKKSLGTIRDGAETPQKPAVLT